MMMMMLVVSCTGVGCGAAEGESDRVPAGQLVCDDGMRSRRPHPRPAQQRHPLRRHCR